MRCRDLAYDVLLARDVGQREQPRSQPITVRRVPPYEPLSLHGPQQPQHRRLVYAELRRELVQRPLAVTEAGQDLQRPAEALTHAGPILVSAHSSSEQVSSRSRISG